MTRITYLSRPTLSLNHIVFLTDDDLWIIGKSGGEAKRLTHDDGQAQAPYLSPDGQTIAYASTASGQNDIHLLPITGGMPKRLTYFGHNTLPLGWKNNNTLLIKSLKGSAFMQPSTTYEINIHTGELKEINLGPINRMETTANGDQIIMRYDGDPAHWKRYQGGTIGQIWVKPKGLKSFRQILKSMTYQMTNLRQHKGRILFLSDYEGHANIYSCNLRGTGIKRLTNNEDYYIRSFDVCGDQLVYMAAGSLFLLDLNTLEIDEISVDVNSPFQQAKERFECPSPYLEAITANNDGQDIMMITRGQLFTFEPWEGGYIRLGNKKRRYKDVISLPEKENHWLAIELNQENEEKLVLIDNNKLTLKNVAPQYDWGKIIHLSPSPNGKYIAIGNNRSQLFLLTLNSSKIELIHQSFLGEINDTTWSPDSRNLVFVSGMDKERASGLHLFDLQKKAVRLIIPPIHEDFSPCFDPEGRYLYFLGKREFHPIWSEAFVDLPFSKVIKAYAIVLDKQSPSPLDLNKAFENEEKEDDDKKDEIDDKKNKKRKKKEETVPKTIIDWDNIEDRIIALPFGTSGLNNILATSDKIFFTQTKNTPISPFNPCAPKTKLKCYDLKEQKLETFHNDVDFYDLTPNKKYLYLYSDHNFRIVPSDNKPSDGDEISKKDGWIDLDRISLKINPKEEWLQIYQEAWILQREHFWTDDLSKIDWPAVYDKYLPLVKKAHTRAELSDILWEMQGELGTGHCYEWGGDYVRPSRKEMTGHLGAKFKYSPTRKSFIILKTLKGESYVPSYTSPLRAPGVALKEGDEILGVNGETFEGPHDLDQSLANLHGEEVNLFVKRKGKKEAEWVFVKTIQHEKLLEYHDWIEKNRAYVHKKSKGKLGYVHIPNMSIWGYSEFMRLYLTEHKHDGLIVDVRFNGGGFCSQLIFKFLTQKVVGFDQTRYWGADAYPSMAVNGPMVCLTNQYAGSDGDIFSHSFKLFNLGKLIGKKTWGGVIGMWPRHRLIDNSMTSQPEFSFWFKDVGWGVENYGTDPDIDVEITPDDFAKNLDPQLDQGIIEGLKAIKKNPPLRPNLKKDRPNLKAPKLPKH